MQMNSETKRITLPYINKVSEFASRLFKQHRIEVAHKPTQKLRAMFTKHKDTTNFLDKSNAIYMFPYSNCDYAYVEGTSKKISTRLTEHKNTIRRHDQGHYQQNTRMTQDTNFTEMTLNY